MRATRKGMVARKAPQTFERLSAEFPLRPIHDEVGLENAQEVVDALALLPTRNRDQEDYLETLSTLIERYEADVMEGEAKRLPVVELLTYLLDAHGWSASDLGRLLGERSLGAKLLGGERSLSKRHIVKLAERFAVSPALFLR